MATLPHAHETSVTTTGMPGSAAAWLDVLESPHYLPDQPDLYWREAHVLVTGIKPGWNIPISRRRQRV